MEQTGISYASIAYNKVVKKWLYASYEHSYTHLEALEVQIQVSFLTKQATLHNNK
jgi:hypothetical protein